MSGGFGRRGLAAGAARTTGNPLGGRDRPAIPATSPDDGLSPLARAFLAAERARGTQAPASAAPAFTAAAPATRLPQARPKADRSMLLAYVMWWFGAFVAAHRFYLGAYRSAFALLGLFWGGLLIAGMMSKKSTLWIGGIAVPPPGVAMMLIAILWVVVDVFLIPGLTRRYRERQRSEALAHVFD